MIRTRELTVSYGALPVLQNINLEIQPGEFVVITGPSGCGKSTLAYALSGLIPHAIHAQVSGTIETGGLDTQKHSLREIVKQAGIVLQNPSSQLFHLRVEDEVAFGPRNLGLDEAEVSARTHWAIHATGLETLRERRPSELSGGQKQCVAIAAILAMRPKILILDEPTASLDLPSTQRVLDTLRNLQSAHGVTIVVVEHRLADIARMASRLILMEQGRIVSDGPPASILAKHTVRDQLGLDPLIAAPPVTWEGLAEADQQHTGSSQPLLTLEKIAAGYQRNKVIEDVNLTLYPGDFVALVGDNGAGKSTVGLVAAGLLKPLAGRVQFQNGARPRPGLDVAMLFQNPADQLFTDSVEEEVAFGPHNYRCFVPDRHQEILQETDLLALRQRSPLLLSTGQQQRTVLAACLSLHPRLVILDEPTLGQDWDHLRRVMDFLKYLNQQGTAILLISHDYKLVYQYARRVYLMSHGKMHGVGQWHPAAESKSRPATKDGSNNSVNGVEFGYARHTSKPPIPQLSVRN